MRKIGILGLSVLAGLFSACTTATPLAYPNPLPAEPPSTCEVTRPPEPPFEAPAPASPREIHPGLFWYGSPDLWTMLGTSGTWSGPPHDANGYSQEVLWWREGYDPHDEPKPDLTVVATRLDGPEPTVSFEDATHLGSAMRVGVTLPTAGCWQITGQYHGHELSFIVWVAP